MHATLVFELARKIETTSAVSPLTLICSFLFLGADTPEQNNDVNQNYTY
jgi:hypothetical protein